LIGVTRRIKARASTHLERFMGVFDSVIGAAGFAQSGGGTGQRNLMGSLGSLGSLGDPAGMLRGLLRR